MSRPISPDRILLIAAGGLSVPLIAAVCVIVISHSQHAKHPQQSIDELCRHARMSSETADYASAERDLTNALDHSDLQDPLTRGIVTLQLADTYAREHSPKAESTFARAVALFDRAASSSALATKRTAADRRFHAAWAFARYLQDRRQTSESLAEYEVARKLCNDAVPVEDRGALDHEYAALLRANGDQKRAEELEAMAEYDADKCFGKAIDFFSRSRFSKAELYFGRVRELAAHKSDNLLIARSLTYSAMIALDEQNILKSQSLVEKSDDIIANLPKPENRPPLTACNLAVMSVIEVERGDLAKSAGLAKRAKALNRVWAKATVAFCSSILKNRNQSAYAKLQRVTKQLDLS